MQLYGLRIQRHAMEVYGVHQKLKTVSTIQQMAALQEHHQQSQLSKKSIQQGLFSGEKKVSKQH